MVLLAYRCVSNSNHPKFTKPAPSRTTIILSSHVSLALTVALISSAPPAANAPIHHGRSRFGAVLVPVLLFLAGVTDADLARIEQDDHGAALRARRALDGLLAVDQRSNAFFGRQPLAAIPIVRSRHTVAGVPVLVHRVASTTPTTTTTHSAQPRVLLYIHGGGWTIGSPELDGPLVDAVVAAKGGAYVAVSVRYRLAPEHPYPAALDDVTAVARALAHHGLAALDAEAATTATAVAVESARPAIQPIGSTASSATTTSSSSTGAAAPKLTLAGVSAGGNLAAAVLLRLASEGDTATLGRVGKQVLLYPSLHAACRPCHASAGRYGRGYRLTEGMSAFFIRMYTGRDEERVRDFLVSPVRAPPALLATQPPATIVLGGADPLHDEGAEYARRLGLAGAAVRLVDLPGRLHAELDEEFLAAFVGALDKQ